LRFIGREKHEDIEADAERQQIMIEAQA